VLGAEKWGLSESTAALVDQALFIPMQGMVQSLNVSVATATLLFEWAYPQVAAWCRREGRPYPVLDGEGAISEELPRSLRLRC